MTIAAAIADEYGVVLAVDTLQGRSGYFLDTPINKLVKVGQLVAAVSGPVAGLALTRRALNRGLEGISPASPLYQGTADAVASMLQAELIAARWATNDHPGGPPWYDISILFTDGRTVFEVNPVGEVIEHARGVLCAIGSGSHIALAADCGLRLAGIDDPTRRALLVVRTACRMADGCREPIRLYRVHPGGDLEALET